MVNNGAQLKQLFFSEKCGDYLKVTMKSKQEHCMILCNKIDVITLLRQQITRDTNRMLNHETKNGNKAEHADKRVLNQINCRRKPKKVWTSSETSWFFRETWEKINEIFDELWHFLSLFGTLTDDVIKSDVQELSRLIKWSAWQSLRRNHWSHLLDQLNLETQKYQTYW